MNIESADEYYLTDPEPLETYELLDCTDINALNECLDRAHMPD